MIVHFPAIVELFDKNPTQGGQGSPGGWQSGCEGFAHTEIEEEPVWPPYAQFARAIWP